MKSVLGLSGEELKLLKLRVLSSTCACASGSQTCLTTLGSSDFENKFVCGEIMSYEDLKEHGSETAVKAAGKLRQQGKPYESMLHHICTY